MMNRFTLIIGLAVAGPALANASIVVEILNMPAEVYSFEPVYVLYSVENKGSSPVYLPAEGPPGRGAGIYFAPKGETPIYVRDADPTRATPYADRTMWLAPGERWLFYEDVGYRLGLLEGEVAIQAVMSSQGHCHDQQIGGRRSFPLEPLFIKTLRRGVRSLPVYQCWEGEARSSVWTLSVKAPTSPIDLEARESLLQNRSLSLNQETGRWYLLSAGYRIRDKFPSSHYTYAFLARIGSNVHEKQLAVDLQQDNTLNPWVVGAIARHYLDHRSSCWKGESLGLDYSIEDLALPAGVGEYLAQYRWQLENRHCPPVVSNGNGGRNGVVHPTATSGLTVPDSVSTVLFSMNQPNRTLDETQARSNSPQRVAGARLVARDFRTPVSSRNLGSSPSRSALI